MSQTHPTRVATAGGGHRVRPRSALRRWSVLALGVAAIALLLSLAPRLHAPLGIADSVTLLQEREIDAGAIFYNTVEQVPTAEAIMRAGMREPNPEQK